MFKNAFYFRENAPNTQIIGKNNTIKASDILDIRYVFIDDTSKKEPKKVYFLVIWINTSKYLKQNEFLFMEK